MKKALKRFDAIGMHDDDVANIQSDVAGIRGNLDNCGLTDEDRRRGVDVSELVSD